MAKPDYVARVSEPTRWSAIVLLLVATIVSTACFLLVVGIAILGIDDVPAGPLYSCMAIFGVLTVVCGWMLIRLLRRHRASNGRTVMPEWFIQLFGVVFFVGICVTAIFKGQWWLFSEALGVAFAMIGVRTLLRHEISEVEES